MKVQTLNQNKDFRRAYAKGKYAAHPLLVTYAVKNRLGVCRIGITASKKIGGAVERNRARRIIRAAFRPWEEKLKSGYDIVLVARTGTTLARSTQLEPVLKKHLRKLGLLENDEKISSVPGEILPPAHL